MPTPKNHDSPVRPRLRRRTLLRGSVAVGATALAPTLWLRRASASTSIFAHAEHVVVLFARGGLRSHCLFNAVGSSVHNPFGAAEVSIQTEWTPGAVLGTSDIETTNHGTHPGLHALTQHVAVVGAVDLDPTADAPLVNHDEAVSLLASGLPGERQGLLSRLLEAHPRYADGFDVDNLPPVDIGNTQFGATDTMSSPLRLPSQGPSLTRVELVDDWTTALRRKFNDRFAARTADAYDYRLSRLEQGKSDAFAFSKLLVDPVLDVLGSPEASAYGVSNAELLEVLGNADLADLGDGESLRSWGPDVAMALRMLGLGAPMVVVERDHFDTHSNEDDDLPIRVGDLARQLAGMRALLSKMEHADGGSLWDRTVVTVVSEFNRHGSDGNPFNSGSGSDHQTTEAEVVRYQAVPLMGGVIENAGAGGRLLAPTDASLAPADAVVSMRSLYSTLLDALGVADHGYWSDPPLAELFT